MFFFRKHPYFLRILSLTCLLSTLQATLAPTISWALTAGPTAPEFSSFEPVDTTDMVNLSTGDFTYSVPLLDVPGPEGGYPLALSYHAGISPDLEASWVGLGWNLNAGAINRYISGVPDDFNGVIRSVHSYWDGGHTNYYSVGVGYGKAMFNLTFANDTYKGLGMGIGLGIRSKSEQGGTIGASVGVQPYGGYYAGASIGQGVSGASQLGISGSVSTNFNTVTTSIGGNGLGLSLSTSSNNSAVLGAGGGTYDLSSNKAGKISSETSGMNVIIPTPYNINFSLGYNYHRYWSDEKDETIVYGPLHYSKNLYSPTHYLNPSLDSYAIFDLDLPEGELGEPDKQKGGSFPAFDDYIVTGQGIGGVIKPYLFENTHLFRKRIVEENQNPYLFHVTYGYTDRKVGKVNFRFKNDFSNSFEINSDGYPDLSVPGNYISLDPEIRNFNPQGFNNSTNHLAGSRHIEWFTNFEINQGVAYAKGFITYEDFYTARTLGKYDEYDNQNLKDQIGGFMITNESGVTYHYSLPVYAYDEYSRNQNSDNTVYRESLLRQPYAYTWLLTGITGPDYVDRGNYGFSEDDYGYWVKFDYGMWSDAYKWRNPGTDWHNDLDSEFRFYSRGLKELYYLDAVSTRSHTAVFIKSLKSDGKSVADIVNGGFNPGQQLLSEIDLPQGYDFGRVYQNGDMHYYDIPVSTLKLDKILLLSNQELQRVLLEEISSISLRDLKSNGNYGSRSILYSGEFEDCILVDPENSLLDECTPVSISKDVRIPEYYDNLIDIDDGAVIDKLNSRCLREISFKTDYSLCGNTPNSFDLFFDGKIPGKGADKGKLTLNALSFRGKHGTSILPDITFAYGTGMDNPDYDKNKHDIWGMYKSDYVDLGNENLSRRVTEASAQHIDAWSLREIQTSVGAKIRIEYESDRYARSAIYKPESLSLKSLELLPNGNVEIRFHESDLDLTTVLSLENKVKITALLAFPHKVTRDSESTEYSSFEHEIVEYAEELSEIVLVNSGAIEVANAALSAKLNEIKSLRFANCGSRVLMKYSYLKPIALGGVLSFSTPFGAIGGGLRTKSIEVYSEENQQSFITTYFYEHEGKSTGITSYEPLGNLKSIVQLPANSDYFVAQARSMLCESTAEVLTEELNKKINRKSYNMLVMTRDLPSPGVFYEKVYVRESIKDKYDVEIYLPGKKEYEFSVFEAEGDFSDFEREASLDANDNRLKTVVLKDFTSRVGNLKQYTVYGNEDQILERLVNVYLEDEVTNNNDYGAALQARFNNQGKIEQLYHEYKFIGEEQAKAFVYSRRIEYPSVLVRQERLYKNGVRTESRNLEFDFYAGVPAKVLTSDSYGNYYVSEVTPAYKIPSYSSMGLKIHNSSNKHMLTQTAKNMTYKVQSESNHTPAGLIAAGISTWSTGIPVEGAGLQSVWRPNATYIYGGDLNTSLAHNGLLDYGEYTSDVFNSWITDVQPQNSSWLKTSEITAYDMYSTPLEIKDINGSYSALRKNPSHTNVIAEVYNAKYEEFGYSGAEYYTQGYPIEGGVHIGEGILSVENVHTGRRSLLLEPGKSACYFSINDNQVDIGKKYRATVWVYALGAGLAGVKLQCTHNGQDYIATPDESLKARNWYQLNLDITPAAQSKLEFSVKNEGSRGVYIDDFRVCPFEVMMNSYVYNEYGELEAVLDNDHFYTRFEYDNAGRLKSTFKELIQVREKKVSEAWYNYKVK